jgi:threonine/homoserine/homoserine lactone efflux protein
MPIDSGIYATFLGTIALIFIPGPGMLFIVANGIRRGPSGGAAAAVGMGWNGDPYHCRRGRAIRSG